MKFKFVREPIERVKADVVVVLCQQKVKDKKDKGIAVLQKGDGGIDLDKYLNSLITGVIKNETFRGEEGSYKIIYTAGKITARVILLVGMGKLSEYSTDVSRKIGAKITSLAGEIKARSVAGMIQNESLKGFLPIDRIQALAEGFMLGDYKFERYKDKKDVEPNTLEDVIFIATKGSTSKIEAVVKKAELICEGVNLVRDLVNTPARDQSPDDLAKKAKEIAKAARLECKVLGPKEIREEKMGLLLAVARGAENEPRFIHMSYRPTSKPKAKIALVGKGITFDTGGYDLKPSRHMLGMKNDMTGAAICIALMKIIGALKPKISVDAYLPVTDNMIDAKAEVPGNIARARSGKTVEIVNTDAEGRLVLADAMNYALDGKPDYMIDLATLTGGVLYALGEIYTAVLGNDQKFVNKYLASAKAESEPAWQLPLVKEYKKGFTDGIADLKNIAKTHADTIAGALFLQEFVGDSKWIHLDIAESAWAEEERDYNPKGGTGVPLRTVLNLLETI